MPVGPESSRSAELDSVSGCQCRENVFYPNLP